MCRRAAAFHPGQVSSHQRDPCSQGSRNYSALHHSRITSHVFKTLLIPLHLHLKAQHTLTGLHVEPSPWDSSSVSSVLSPEATHRGGLPFPQDPEKALALDTKDKLSCRKAMFLLKTQCGPQKPTLEEKSHTWGVILDNGTGVSTSESILCIRIRMAPWRWIYFYSPIGNTSLPAAFKKL